MTNTEASILFMSEIKEFASFIPSTQRYIKRSLDVGFGKTDVKKIWARDESEYESIEEQMRIYAVLTELRNEIPLTMECADTALFIGELANISSFDLRGGYLPTFGSYRFLYERLLGAGARPWLMSGFMAAAALPGVHPKRRKSLLYSISDAAVMTTGWSKIEPTIFPEWVDKVAEYT